MGTERRRQLLLAAVAVILALIVYQSWPTTSAGLAPSSNREAQARPGQKGPATPAAPEVHLGALDAGRAKPESSERNLFRFKTKPLPPPPPPPPPQPVVAAPVAPSGPPPLQPIALKFIGLVEETEHAQKIAILSDGRNVPYYGREGDIIEGRYRILKIGVESIEIAYVDGRGRQTIRLTGG